MIKYHIQSTSVVNYEELFLQVKGWGTLYDVALYVTHSQYGSCFRMRRKTISKRFTAKLKAYKEWLKANRILPTGEILLTTAAKLRGHFAYYGVSDNAKSINSFSYWVTITLFKWLNRRGKRGCYTWEKFNKLLKRYPLPKARTTVNLLSF